MADNFLRVKCLVDQTTSQVVWLKMYPENTPIPNFDPSLNYYKLEGVDLGVDDMWDVYTRYQLFLEYGRFIEKTDDAHARPDFKQIQLLRARSMVADRINGLVNVMYEKYNLGQHAGLHTTELVLGEIGDHWVNFFSKEYNCSKDNAKKLIEFKVSEWRNVQFMLETIRETSINKIKNAKTLDDITTQFNLICTRLVLSGNTSIKDLPVITGVPVSPIK